MLTTDTRTLRRQFQGLRSWQAHHDTAVRHRLEKYAGEGEADNAVHASNCSFSRKRQRPTEEKICKMISLFKASESEGGSVETTVMHSRICRSAHHDCTVTLMVMILGNARDMLR